MRGERLMDIKKYGFQMIWEWILKLEIICHWVENTQRQLKMVLGVLHFKSELRRGWVMKWGWIVWTKYY
jgi:hypothetical protein